METSTSPPQLISFRPRLLWRVHVKSYRAAQSYATSDQSSCFMPIYRDDGSSVRVLCATTSLSAAQWSTAFHHLPATRANYILDFAKLEERGLCVSCIQPRGRMLLAKIPEARLFGSAPRRKWLQPPVLGHANTRAWVRQIYAMGSVKGRGLIKGVLWDIRELEVRGKRAQGILLFGDRVRESDFEVKGKRMPLCSGTALHSLVALADDIGICGVY